MRLYLDSSLLVKLYVPEPDSETLIMGLRRLEARLVLTRFQFLELSNAINRKQKEGRWTADQVKAARRNLSRDRSLGLGFVDTLVDLHEALGNAIKISDRWSPEYGARSLDLIHIAIARLLKVDAFATGDSQQNGVAKIIADKSGLRVIDPRQA